VHFYAAVTHKLAAVSTVASGNGLFTFLTFSFLCLLCLDKCVSDLKEMIDVECSLQAFDSLRREWDATAAVGAGEVVLVRTFLDGLLEALCAEDVEAREGSWVCVSPKANSTLQTGLYFLQSLLCQVFLCHYGPKS